MEEFLNSLEQRFSGISACRDLILLSCPVEVSAPLSRTQFGAAETAAAWARPQDVF
jgi:hypothetical protein